MTFFATCPGSCGEFIQGSIQGTKILITCPINAYVQAEYSSSPHLLHPKGQVMKDLVLKELKSLGFPVDSKRVPHIHIKSALEPGKGMASSSADLSLIAFLMARYYDYPITYEDIDRWALSIEPTNPVYCPGTVLFDYVTGSRKDIFEPCPPMDVLLFDEGGQVDTIYFNQQKGLHQLISEKEHIIEEALYYFKKGLEDEDIRLIGRASSMSAFANQIIMPKRSLEAFSEIGAHYGSVGIVIGHSGTVRSLLFPPNRQKSKMRALRAIQKELPFLVYKGSYKTTFEGLRVYDIE